MACPYWSGSMKKKILLLSLSVMLLQSVVNVNTCVNAAVPAVANLMPQPVSVIQNNEALPIGGLIKWNFSTLKDPFLERASARFVSSLQKRTGMIWDDSLPSVPITIECAAADPGLGTIKAKESYNLTVDSKGIVLKAEGQAGVLRGLATLLQLAEYGPKGFQFAGATIDDKPRFVWRGLLMDPARHHISVETLKRQIDAMEATKLNVMHLHLSDHEAFRVESKAFPKLHETAPFGEYYTQDQIRDLVQYAADRGVRIIPEFDMPGHSGSEVKAYPYLGTPTDKADAPDGVLDPTRETTYQFLEGFLDEMTRLFPDAFYHMGGDEVGGESWNKDPAIQTYMKEKGLKDKTELQAYFTNRFKEMLDKRGKIMIGWDEIVNPKLPGKVLVQSWRSFDMTAKSAQAGYPVLVSNGYYTDMLTPADKHYVLDPTEKTDVQQGYVEGADKAPPLTLTEEQKAKFIGGEVCMWGELATDEMMDARNWPRTAAVAERYWSPATVRDVDDMYRRLIVIDNLLAANGLNQHANVDRMAARLVPNRSPILETFITAVRPAPNWSHFKRFRSNWTVEKPIQQFNEIADIAPPDSLIEKRLELDVKNFLADGAQNPDLRQTIRTQLEKWRDNHAEFKRLAVGMPALEAALPRSQDVHDLSVAGLESLDMLQKKSPPAADWIERQNAIIKQQDLFDAATESMGTVSTKPQPPADLLLVIQQPVRLLVDAAAKLAGGSAPSTTTPSEHSATPQNGAPAPGAPDPATHPN